jgi:ABC-type branched-subunit amino acid transport system ATPase component
MAMQNLLTDSDPEKRFAGPQMVAGVSFEVARGTVHGLIGHNGYGKATEFNLLTGFLTADGGGSHCRDRPILGLRPHKIARLGLCRTFQSSLNPERMTVLDNLLLAPQAQTGESIAGAARRRRTVRAQEAKHQARAREVLARIAMAHMADEYVGSLSGGQRKLLSLAQALMTEPELILLDEPVAGVNPRLIDDIVAIIRALRDEHGITFLVVEHNMNVVRRICDRVSILDAGRVIAAGPPVETLAREEVMAAYLGGHASTSRRTRPAPEA